MDEKLKAFLSELAQLTQKYDIAVYGCGCCDSLEAINKNGEAIGSLANKLSYDHTEKKYEFDEPYGKYSP